jgi:hypothetical protein
MSSARISITSRNFSCVTNEIVIAYLINLRHEGPTVIGVDVSFGSDDDIIHAELEGSGING